MSSPFPFSLSTASGRSPRRLPLRRGLALVQAVLMVASTACIPRRGLAPIAGLPAYQTPLRIEVPGAEIHTAGGNVLVRRVDLSIDTRVVPFELSRSYSSAHGAWIFSVDVHLAEERFVDASGTRYELAGVPAERVLPGSDWVRMDDRTLRTRGGLVHVFADGGRLEAIHWLGDEYPRLAFRGEPLAGESRVTAVDQCLAAEDCRPLLALERDSEGRIERVTDRAGRRCEYEWGVGQQLQVARDARAVEQGGAGERFAYSGAARLVLWQSGDGERVDFAYERGRVQRVRALADEPAEWRFAYGEEADRGLYFTRVWDPLGHERTYRYDGRRRIRELVFGAGERLAFGWDEERVVRLEGLDGRVTRWAWLEDDPLWRLDPSGRATIFTWAPRGRRPEQPFARALARAEDQLGVLEARSYDADGRVVEVVDAAGQATRIAYGPTGLPSEVRGPDGVVTRLSEYGEHGHPQLVEGAGWVERREYDAVGNLVAGGGLETPESPGRPGVLERRFDAGRALASLVVAGVQGVIPDPPEEIRIERRADGRPLSIFRPYGGDTRYAYDDRGRLESRQERVDGTWRTTRWRYDAAGRVVERELANGTARRDAWDALGRLVERTWLRDGISERSLRFAYDGLRVRERHDPARPAPERLEYDAGGRLRSVRFPDGERLQLAHDLRSRIVREEFVDAEGRTRRVLGYRYDGVGRPLALLDGETELLARRYEQGRLVEDRTGNGLVRRYEYDSEDGGLRRTVTRDEQGRVVAESELQDTRHCRSILTGCRSVHSWSEAAGGTSFHEIAHFWPRLEAGVGSGLPGVRAVSWSDGWSPHYLGQADQLAYDALGNVSIAHPGEETDFVYNAERNRLVEGAGHRYGYDAAGFVVERDGEALRWDAQGRIAQVGERMRFEWDAMARPLRRELGGETTLYRFGGRVEADSDGRWQLLHAPGSRLGLSDGQQRFEHRDERGNVRFVSDEEGRVVSHLQYRAFGLGHQAGAEPARRGFAGGEELGGLVLLGARLYDADVARFLAPDPVHQLVNQYAYTLGNPYWLWDPDGLSAAAIRADAIIGYGIEIAGHGVRLVAAGLLGTGLLVTGAGVLLVAASLAVAVLEGAGLVPSAAPGEAANIEPAAGPPASGSQDDASGSAAAATSACAPSRVTRGDDPGRSFWVLGAIQVLALAAWWRRRAERGGAGSIRRHPDGPSG